MIDDKKIPEEFVSIRQVWLRQIDRCTEAFTNRFMRDVRDERSDKSGTATVVESVDTLWYTLIDYGEATVKSDVDCWYDEVFLKAPDKNKQLKWARKQFIFIIETLNKYGMLFESTPKGYSNVEMRSV